MKNSNLIHINFWKIEKSKKKNSKKKFFLILFNFDFLFFQIIEDINLILIELIELIKLVISWREVALIVIVQAKVLLLILKRRL